MLSVSEESLVVVNEQVFDPANSKTRSYFDLVRGKLNSIVSDYYGRPGASYQVKTATAVAGVRGTEFSISYDPDDEVTEVLGFNGTVQVHSLLDPAGPGVIITANEATTVAQGRLPTLPQRYNESIIRHQLDGIQFHRRWPLRERQRGPSVGGGIHRASGRTGHQRCCRVSLPPGACTTPAP